MIMPSEIVNETTQQEMNTGMKARTQTTHGVLKTYMMKLTMNQQNDTTSIIT
jgi:hypothetical protein